MTVKNEYAYPQTSPVPVGEEGLTKREYFAGLALQGLLSDPELGYVFSTQDETISSTVKASIKFADALIAELNKNT